MARPPRATSFGMSEEAKAARTKRIGGTDARIIMSGDQRAIERLWRLKRGEVEDENLDDVLLVQLGNATEDLNLHWFEKQTGFVVTDDQAVCHDPEWPICACTLDGKVRDTADGPAIGIMDAKYMFPFHWNMDKAIGKYSTQLQHNMTAAQVDRSWLSVIVGDGRYAYAEIPFDPFYAVMLREAEMDFWDCVETGRTPGVPIVEAPTPVPVKILDMSGSNSWAMMAGVMSETLEASLRHELAKAEIKKLFPADGLKATGHGVSLSRSKDGKVMMDIEGAKAAKARVKDLLLA